MKGKMMGAVLGALGILIASIALTGTVAALRPDGEVDALVLLVGSEAVALVEDAGDATDVLVDDSLTMAAEQVAASPGTVGEVVDQVPAVAQSAADQVNAGAAAMADLTEDSAALGGAAVDRANDNTVASLGEARDFTARSGDRLHDFTDRVLTPTPPVVAAVVDLPDDTVLPSATYQVVVGPVDIHQLPPEPPTVMVNVDPGHVSLGPLPQVADHLSGATQDFVMGTADDASRTGSAVIAPWTTL